MTTDPLLTVELAGERLAVIQADLSRAVAVYRNACANAACAAEGKLDDVQAELDHYKLLAPIRPTAYSPVPGPPINEPLGRSRQDPGAVRSVCAGDLK